jgi:hypothetical protein
MTARLALVLFAGTDVPCKLQHAFIFARDVAQRGGEARIIFEGNSPQWLLQFTDPENKMTRLFQQVQDQGLIAGVCKGCATMHDAVEAAEALGLPLMSDAFGHVSLAPWADDGYQILTL